MSISIGHPAARTWQAFFTAALLLVTGLVHAQGQYELEFGARAGSVQPQLNLAAGKSQIIRADEKLDQVVIGNPEVADIKLISDRQVLILGIKPGHTNLVLKNKRRDLVALMDVVVGYDVLGIAGKLREVLPKERALRIATSNNAVILSGKIADAGSLEKALAVTRSYVPADNIINLVRVEGGHQVMLEVKVSEVSRTSLKDLGVKSNFLSASGDTAFNWTGESATAEKLNEVIVKGLGGNVADMLDVTLNVLEQKGLARTLAEPNLVAMSGQEASFLAGGEIPIPVAQSDVLGGASAITVEYKPFGVGLKFTPTVLSSDQINLQLSTEVSAIDDADPFTLGGGLNIPRLTTRRMATTIEMGDGQSFAIAGLLQNDLNESIRQFPWLGDVPIIGSLFRSSTYNREETELVVIVTPRIVQPTTKKNLKAPTDNLVPPNQLEWFLLGQMEGRGKAAAGTGPAAGYQGDFGHE